MVILLLLSASPIIIKALMGDITENNKKKNLYMIICGLCIVFVMGLRSRFAGSPDTNNNCKLFESIQISNIGLLDFIKSRSEGNSLLLSEFGYSVFVWLLANIFPSAQWLIFTIALITTVCTLRFIYKHSEDIVVSIVMFLCLGLFSFNMNGLRQCIAMSICLIAYDFIKEKKFVPFAILIIVAMSFHKSAVIFGFSYLFYKFKPNLYYTALFVAILLVITIFADNISLMYDNIVGQDYSSGESFETGGIVVVLIYLLTLGTALLFNKKLTDQDVYFIFLMSLMGLSLYVIRFISTQMYERISYYFNYYILLLLPSTIARFDGKSKILINSIIIILSIALFAYRLIGTNFALII